MDTLHDLFLSHSHRDEKAAQRLAEKLREWKLDVYVDFADPAMMQLVDHGIAERLIAKIRRCRMLLFAFSSASAESKWMPWELGLAHGVVGRIVLWPLDAGARRAAAEQEYLGLYETLEPKTARERLKTLVQHARDESVAPAAREAAAQLGQVTLAKAPQLNQPDVFTEFVVNGPMQLYTAWMNALLGRR